MIRPTSDKTDKCFFSLHHSSLGIIRISVSIMFPVSSSHPLSVGRLVGRRCPPTIRGCRWCLTRVIGKSGTQGSNVAWFYPEDTQVEEKCFTYIMIAIVPASNVPIVGTKDGALVLEGKSVGLTVGANVWSDIPTSTSISTTDATSSLNSTEFTNMIISSLTST